MNREPVNAAPAGTTRSVTRDLVYSFSGRLLGLGSASVVLIILARGLDRADYDDYATAGTILAIAALVSDPGLIHSVGRFVSDAYPGRAAVWATARKGTWLELLVGVGVVAVVGGGCLVAIAATGSSVRRQASFMASNRSSCRV